MSTSQKLNKYVFVCILNDWHIIAILKPGKDSAKPKSYRPISLLCHMYKLYERLILNRIAPSVDRHLIKEQAGFRPGKSCCSQLLNLTQHIEDGYQRGMITYTQTTSHFTMEPGTLSMQMIYVLQPNIHPSLR